MPTSPYAHIEYIVNILHQIRPSSILDIGLGNGKIGFIARDFLDVMLNEAYLKRDWKVKIDGIEIFEPYIQTHQRFIYDDIFIGDAFDVIDRLGKYDLVILGDVLEHFNKEKAWQFLDKCAFHSNMALIINIPLGDCPQPNIYGNEYERHCSTWFEDDFDSFLLQKRIFVLSNSMRYGSFLIEKDKYLLHRLELFIKESNDLIQSGQFVVASKLLKYAIKLDNTKAELYNNLGLAYSEMKMIGGAITSFLRAINLNPDFHIAHFNLANTYKNSGNIFKAIGHYIKALEINPNAYYSAYSLGILYKTLSLYDEAFICFEITTVINPNHVNAYINMGALRHMQGRYDEAIKLYNKAISIDTDNPDAHWNLSLTLLLTGDFKKGWLEYQWRWRLGGVINPSVNIPLWDGKSKGESILLITEQGLGDAIQFVRYTSLLNEKGFKVSIQCQNELVNLFKVVERVEKVYSFDEDLPCFDFYSPIMSLPYLFDTDLNNIPSHVPYIFASDESIKKFDNLIQDHNKFKIGIAWAGKSTHKDDNNRSIKLSRFKPLFDIADIDFYSLQIGDASFEGRAFDKLIDLTDYINDFYDTAGLIYHLDLIITVDTAVAHLSGAMAKKVWILLPFCPDWRWLLNREDSPWYPTVRLFRQAKSGDWDEVIERIRGEIKLTYC